MNASPHIVSDVMTHTVVAVGQRASFKEIVGTMEKWKVSALPVLAGDNRVVGVVSEADLLPKEEFRDGYPTGFDSGRRLGALAKAEALEAESLMTAPAACVHGDSTLAQAARIMAQRRIKRLPVTDGEGRLRGIVSRSDLLKVFLRTDAELTEEVRHEVVDRLFPGDPSVSVDVHDGLVRLEGTVEQPGMITVAARLARAVEGVVDVRCTVRGASPRQAPAAGER